MSADDLTRLEWKHAHDARGRSHGGSGGAGSGAQSAGGGGGGVVRVFFGDTELKPFRCSADYAAKRHERRARRAAIKSIGAQLGLRPGDGPFRITTTGTLPYGLEHGRAYYVPLTPEQQRRRDLRAARRARKQRRGWA